MNKDGKIETFADKAKIISFASDNNSGVHPEIFKALADANAGHAVGYGEDPWTASAIQQFKKVFGQDIEVFFVYNGTAANILSLQTLLRSYQAVICTMSAHINVDECGAPEHIFGSKLIDLHTTDGKLRLEDLKPQLIGLRDVHHVQPHVVSITQATEMGTVYTIEEIRGITSWAHKNGLYVHMDGARISNAAVALGVSLKEMTTDSGIDVLSFGGTKNGLMFGEAAIFFDADLAKSTPYYRKQNQQLASKMRYISCQMEAILTADLWKKNALHANRMAKLLAEKIADIPQIEITKPVQINQVFVKIPRELIEPLQKEYFFYMWDESIPEARWMTSFDTTEQNVIDFVETIKQIVSKM